MSKSLIEVIIPTFKKPHEVHGLVERIKMAAGCPVKILYTGLQASASANRNRGLFWSHGEVVAMVDDDVEFDGESQGWLANMLKVLFRPEVVMVSSQLLKPSGEFAYMTGLQDCGLKPKTEGESIVPSKRLLTACCAFKHHGLRFDEDYVGSGFEDVDFCNQLSQKVPDGQFVVCHDAKVIHRNEQKHQHGANYEHNKALYFKKWGLT